MKRKKSRFFFRFLSLFTLFLFLVLFQYGDLLPEKAFPAEALLERLNDWQLTEEPLSFLPETLFEYIDGAAEIYLAYNFRFLTVIQLGQEGSAVNLSAEIYEMSSPNNSFGIYSAERFPDSTFIPIGVQGYIEEGALNFLIGRYYVKLICFEGGVKCSEFLKTVAGTIADITRGEMDFPSILRHFPQKGRIANSEKFILKNVMGYSFLHDGYFASYSMDGLEFDCFLIEGKNEDDAREMLESYLEAKKEQPVQELSRGVVIKDRYYKNIYLARVGRTICGVMKIEEDMEGVGEEYLEALMLSLEES